MKVAKFFPTKEQFVQMSPLALATTISSYAFIFTTSVASIVSVPYRLLINLFLPTNSTSEIVFEMFHPTFTPAFIALMIIHSFFWGFVLALYYKGFRAAKVPSVEISPLPRAFIGAGIVSMPVMVAVSFYSPLSGIINLGIVLALFGGLFISMKLRS